MKVRFLAAAAALALAVLPAAAQTKKGPALTFQTAPPGRLLDDFKAIAKMIGGEKGLEDVNRQIKDQLGEKGFTGVDMLRPVVGYAELSDKAEATGGVIVVPVTDQKEFLDFLKRAKMNVEEGQGGLYKLSPAEKADANQKNPPTRLRFKDKYAYLGINVQDENFTADKLVPVSELEMANETAAFAYRLHIDRIPEGLKKQGYEALDKAVEELKGVPGNGPPEAAAKAAGEAFAKLLKRVGDQVLTDGDTAFFRVRLDTQSGDAALEAALSAKKGSQLAKDIAARKPTTNRFAGLLTKDMAAGLVFQAPLFAPEVREAVAGVLESLQKQAAQDTPPMYKDLADEAFKGAIRTIKSGELDLGAALIGPDKDGLYHASAAVSFDDPSGIEKALRSALKNADPGVKALVQLDAGKVGDVSVHRIAAGAFLPPEAQKVFGDNSAVYLAFAPKGIYAAFGPSGMEVITAAIKARPGPAKALDLVANPSRLHKVIAASDPEAGKKFAELLGTEDKPVSAFSASIEGGEELRLRLTLNLKLLPRAGVAQSTAPPAVKK